MNTEYPKYWECNGLVRRSLTGNHLQKFTAGHWEDGAILCCGCEPITPQRAAELTGDKGILENQTCLAHGKKMSEHNCLEQLRKAQKILEKGGEARPVGIAQLTEAASKLPASPPQWIPVSERLPRDGEHFILGYRLSENWVTSDNFYWPLDIAHSPWTHWHPLAVPPPPPKPQTQAEKDEEAFNEICPERCMGSWEYELGWNKALAYARGEKGEK